MKIPDIVHFVFEEGREKHAIVMDIHDPDMLELNLAIVGHPTLDSSYETKHDNTRYRPHTWHRPEECSGRR